MEYDYEFTLNQIVLTRYVCSDAHYELNLSCGTNVRLQMCREIYRELNSSSPVLVFPNEPFRLQRVELQSLMLQGWSTYAQRCEKVDCGPRVSTA